MSYSYERVQQQRRTTTGGGYGASRGRSTLGYWVPLFMTVTVATIGLAAWIWSERRDDEDETSGEGKPTSGYASMSGGLPPGPGPGGFQGPPPSGSMGPGGYEIPPMPLSAPGYEGGTRSTATEARTREDETLISRISGAFKRTPSPQQSYDWASKKVATGVAAAGAVVGGALTAIREGSQDDYEDHERWSEEADSRDNGKETKKGLKRRGRADDYFSGAVGLPKPAPYLSRKRKNIAIVVSAVGSGRDATGELGQHASILAHLPEYINPESTRAFVLIYAPELGPRTHSAASTSKQAVPLTQGSTTSSFSNISHGDARTPGEFAGGSDSGLATIEPNPLDDCSSLFKTLYNQAVILVERETMIMPFTTRMGHLHLLRSLAPEIVYIQESLCGDDGELAHQLTGWVKQIVVVIGDEGGHGGLVDTEDEDGLSKAHADRWWQEEARTGLGKRVAVVDSLKIGEDWTRRVEGQD